MKELDTPDDREAGEAEPHLERHLSWSPGNRRVEENYTSIESTMSTPARRSPGPPSKIGLAVSRLDWLTHAAEGPSVISAGALGGCRSR